MSNGSRRTDGFQSEFSEHTLYDFYSFVFELHNLTAEFDTSWVKFFTMDRIECVLRDFLFATDFSEILLFPTTCCLSFRRTRQDDRTIHGYNIHNGTRRSPWVQKF